MNEKTKWHDRIFGKKLIKCDSTNNSNDFNSLPTGEILKNVQITGIYFSFANINTQSDDFVKKLRDLYEKLNASCANGDADKRIEVIQVVMWAHNDNYGDFELSHRDSLLGLPWFAMPFSEINLKVSCVAYILILILILSLHMLNLLDQSFDSLVRDLFYFNS